MSENNAHMEEAEKRLKRFQNGPPLEIVDTLLNSIANFFNNEIKLTVEGANRQTSLLFLGVHAVALTIAKGLFNKDGVEGYRVFLENFVDGETPDTKFSTIAEVIHGWRNTVAHHWLGLSGHSIGYDYEMLKGWEERDGKVYINPQIYAQHYLAAFGSGGKIYDYEELFTSEQLEEIKTRLIRRFSDH